MRRFPIGTRPVGSSLSAAHGIGAPGGLTAMRPASPQSDPSNDNPSILEQIDMGLIVPIPAIYTVSLSIGGAVNNTASGATNLRPERFLLQRVTYATTNDLPPIAEISSPVGGRSVRVSWQDEFTRFFGENPSMPAAAFGDSNGFLDLPMPVLFQGKQSLSISLRRIVPAEVDGDPVATDWDFCFIGLGLLPAGAGASGSLNTRR